MSEHTVTFTLAGPMQSWGNAAAGAARPTATTPTKSAVVGIVANALGRDVDDDICDLTALQFTVRIDRPGRVEIDYHTAGGGPMPLMPSEVVADPAMVRAARKHGWGTVSRNYSPPRNIESKRGTLVAKRPAHGVIVRDHYLADAHFTIALTGDAETVAQAASGLNKPARLLYLGRRAYPLSQPPAAVIHDTGDPVTALDSLDDADTTATVHTEQPGGRTVTDQPVNFRTRQRRGRPETTLRRAPLAAPVPDMFTPPES